MTERCVEVKILGELGRKFGRSYKFYVNSPKDVISALSRQIKGFKEYLVNAHENGIGFKLVTNDAEGIDYQELGLVCEQLIIAPIISGAGSNVGRILVGVALVALSFVSFGSSALFAGAFTAGATGSSLLFTLGASLILTGLSALLTPPVSTPKTESERSESFLFDRAAELTTQGFPVPVLYGEFLAQSPLVISSSISTEQIPV
jgi:Phage-related protein, tail component